MLPRAVSTAPFLRAAAACMHAAAAACESALDEAPELLTTMGVALAQGLGAAEFLKVAATAGQLRTSPVAPALAAAACRVWAAVVRVPRRPAMMNELMDQACAPIAYLWDCEGAEAAVAEHFVPGLIVALACADEEVRENACRTLGMGLLLELDGRDRPPRAPAVATLARQRGLLVALVRALRKRGQSATAATAAVFAVGQLVRVAGDMAEPLARLIAASGAALAALARLVESYPGSGEGFEIWVPMKDTITLGCILTVAKVARRDAVAAAIASGLLAALARSAQHGASLCTAGDLSRMDLRLLATNAAVLCDLLWVAPVGANAAAAVLAAALQLPRTGGGAHGWQLKQGSQAHARCSTGPAGAAGRRRRQQQRACGRRRSAP